MFTVRNVLPLLLVVLLLSGLSFGATKVVTKSGPYTTIQSALTAADPCDVIEVQDSQTYAENLLFKVDVNDLTLQAGAGCSPTITVSGTDANTKYINIRSVRTTIKGFTVNFSGLPYAPDGNSTIINATGGASIVRDCNIIGPVSGWIRGIAGVAEINNVEVSQCRIGVLCDANWFATGFDYSVSNSRIYDNRHFGIVFSDCNTTVDNCVIETSGTGGGTGNSNVITEDVNRLNVSLLNLLIKNSIIRSMAGTGRNITLESRGTVTIDNCIIRDAQFDEILQYLGTLNLNYCIIKNSGTTGGCVNVNWDNGNSGRGGGTANIDHCSILGSEQSTQWAVFTVDPNAHVAVTNSILTGPQGLFASVALDAPGGNGYFTSNWNDNDCNSPLEGNGRVVAGAHDLLPKQNPFYIQTHDDSDAGIATYFTLQPYSPVIGKGEFGTNIGAKGYLTGYEKWPADLDGVYGVDKRDLKVFTSEWLHSNTIAAGPNSPLDNFEGYTNTASLDPNWTVPAWDYSLSRTYPAEPNYNYTGPSTLSLLTSGAYEGSQAMRWVYDVNYRPDSSTWRRFTEILVILPHTIDINVFPPYSNPSGQPSSPYNQLKVMLKRHADNSPDLETFMYAKFFDKTKSTPTGGYNKEDLIAHVVGGSTATHPDEWYPWTINLNNMVVDDPLRGHERLTRIGGIIFGIRDQIDGPWGLGKGTIDVDSIELIDLPGCSAPILSDLNGDCVVNFADYVIFANYWMDGK